MATETARQSEPERGVGERQLVRRDVAVVGASAGGVEALMALARSLPADIPVAFLVVLHMPPGGGSRLPEIISRSGPLPATTARHGDRALPGHIYIAAPDTHLTLSDGRMWVIDGPKENGFRPAVDPLFRSAARWAGPRAIGIILSGTMDDGAAGMLAIQAFGGATIVQDPEDALCAGMPEAVLAQLEPDHVLPAAAMGPAIAQVASEAVARPGPGSEPDPSLIADPMVLDAVGVDLACPHCGGALQELFVSGYPRYRCRVGHIFSPEALMAGSADALEGGLWAALRSLEEMAVISSRLARRARDSGADKAAARFEERQADAAQRADLVREAIQSLNRSVNETTEDALGSDAHYEPDRAEAEFPESELARRRTSRRSRENGPEPVVPAARSGRRID